MEFAEAVALAIRTLIVSTAIVAIGLTCGTLIHRLHAWSQRW